MILLKQRERGIKMGLITDIETLILRFRDGLASNSTIEDHQSLISTEKYVWWGWWSKPQETIPAATFSSMCVKIRGNQALPIYLFDSGTLLLYKANCEEIKYTNDKMKLPPPDDGKATPSYYRENSYLAWFKLTSIEPCDEDVLQGYSYVDVDEFYSDGLSHFQAFGNKAIFNAEELHNQQRTIWFIRPKRPDDKSHEIKSFMQSEKVATNVDSTFKVLPYDKILWLSDLHFSKEHHAFTNTQTENNSLLRRLSDVLSKEKVNPSTVIISGDITFKALEDEYKQAEEFIKDMNSVYSLDSSSYAITPGNHDLAFSDSPDKPDSEITKTYPEAQKNYNVFYNKVFGCSPTEELYSIRRFLTPDLVPMEIICVNSCYLQQCKDSFQGLGYVGSNQMGKLAKELILTDHASPIRILVMHHHLMPVMYKETPQYDKAYSLTLDAEAVAQFICQHNIKVVLHGHNHKEFYAEVTRKIKENKKKFYIIGLGSSGVKAEELSDGRQNMFAVITTKKANMTVKGLSLSPAGDEYNEVFCHEIPLVEEVENV